MGEEKLRRIVSCDLYGWESIAVHVGVSIRTAQRYAQDDGLPIMWLKTRVRARSQDLDRWLERQIRLPGIA